MKGITVRFGDDVYEILKQEAELQGIGLTAYIRETIIARAMITRAHRGLYTENQRINEAIRAWLKEENFN